LWNYCGWVLVDLRRDVEAVASYDKGLAINPEDASALFIRGAEQGILGRPAKASHRSIKFVSAEEPTRDKKKKEIFFFSNYSVKPFWHSGQQNPL
jgi:hypothetical protein